MKAISIGKLAGGPWKSRRSLAKVATAASVVLVVSGCGGADGAASGDSTIKIGLPHPMTGAWADGGENAVNGAMMAIEDINDQGGIEALDGAKLEGIEADTSSDDPGQAASVTRRLVERDGVSALVGSYVSAFTLTASTEAEKAGVPMVSQSFSDELTSRDYTHFFQLPPTSSEIGGQTVPYVRDAYAAVGVDITDVSILASNDASIRAQGDAAIEAAKKAGLNVVHSSFYEQDLTEASVLVQKAIRSKPDIIFLGGPTGAAATIMRTLRDLGYEGPVVGLGGGGILTPEFGEMLGDSVNGVLSLASWNWDMPYEELNEVNERYMQEHNVPFMSHEAGQSYVAVWAIKEALEEAGSSEPQDIAEALRNIELTSGLASAMPGGEVAFDETGRSDAFPIMIQWQDGVTNTVWPEEVQVVEPQ